MLVTPSTINHGKNENGVKQVFQKNFFVKKYVRLKTNTCLRKRKKQLKNSN